MRKFQQNSSFTGSMMKIIHFTSKQKNLMIAPQSQKTVAERGNSNNKTLANDSTPILNRAFFVRGLRTPKERLIKRACSSMVGRIGQRLIVGCVPVFAVFHPDTLYRQAWKLAVDCQNLILEFSTMIFKFLTLGKNRLKISVYARNEQEARAKLSFTSPAILCARFNAKRGLYA